MMMVVDGNNQPKNGAIEDLWGDSLSLQWQYMFESPNTNAKGICVEASVAENMVTS